MSRIRASRSRRAALGVALLVVAVVSAPAVGQTAAPSQDATAADAPAVRSPEETILDQLAAFNAADIESLVANVAEEFAWFAVESDGMQVQLTGRDDFRRSMEVYFASVPEPRAEIDTMTVSGNFVAVREVAFWLDVEGEVSQGSLAVYEVRDGLIHRVWYYPVEP